MKTVLSTHHVPHVPQGEWAWTAGIVEEAVMVRGKSRTWLVAQLRDGADEDDAVRIVARNDHGLLEDGEFVVCGGSVEHPKDGSAPVLIVRRVVPGGFDC